jgi:osmotically-inducible protein OsmY
MRNEEENVAQTTASDLKAVAEDMLRMGRHWARAAQGWLERAGDQAQQAQSRLRTRSDRDLQSDYSTGGYDQVDAGRRDRDFGAQARGGQGYGYGYDVETYPGGRDFGGRDYRDVRTGDAAGSDYGSDYGSADYRGVGPRNYTRSDERIREDLNERLTEAYDLDASGLSVEVSGGVATLSGSVPQRWMKHRAEDLADACIGVRDVRNHILVQGAGSSAGRSSNTSAGSTSAGSTHSTSPTGKSAGSAGTTTGQAGSTGKETP